MIRITLPFASAILLAALAACSPPPSGGPAPQTSAAPPPAPAMQTAAQGSGGQDSGGLDGVYRPVGGRASGNSRCGTTTFGYPIRVANGMASMQTVSLGTISGPIAPDGTLKIEQGRGMLQGQFSNGKFTGTYSFNSCAFTMNYAKR